MIVLLEVLLQFMPGLLLKVQHGTHLSKSEKQKKQKHKVPLQKTTGTTNNNVLQRMKEGEGGRRILLKALLFCFPMLFDHATLLFTLLVFSLFCSRLIKSSISNKQTLRCLLLLVGHAKMHVPMSVCVCPYVRVSTTHWPMRCT